MPLVEVLETGDYLEGRYEITHPDKDRYHISDYAALGLGYLGDTRAVEPLLSALANGRHYAVFALTRLGDVRAVKPIIEYASAVGKLDDNVHHCLEYLSAARLQVKYSREDGTFVCPDFPEVGKQGARDIHKSVWLYWLQKGDEFAKHQFEDNYTKWQVLRSERPSDRASQGHVLRDMIRGGIPILPRVMQKVERGDESLLKAAHQLVDRPNSGLSKGAVRSECLQWWTQNKHKWRLFDPKEEPNQRQSPQ